MPMLASWTEPSTSEGKRSEARASPATVELPRSILITNAVFRYAAHSFLVPPIVTASLPSR
jgi:hypothetical protein